jgi:lysophospholipase L1-like esterase
MQKITYLLLMMLFSSFFSFGQDWANLQRYQQANEALQASEKGEQRIVFMGNSITEGWLEIHPAFFKGKPYINRGISGQTTPQMLLRFRQDVIDIEADVVVILAGINDIAGNTGPSTIDMITDNIFSMVELAQANDIRVVLCSVLPAAYFGWSPGIRPAQKVIELNQSLKAYADANEITYVDYFTPMADEYNGLKRELGEDGVHPNLAGYLVMEPLLEAALK